MPSLIIKVIKRPEDPWILNMTTPASLEYFSQSDITDVLSPFHKQVYEMPGLIGIEETTEGDIKTVKYTFDTTENMANSRAVMVESDLAKRRAEVIRLAMANHNIPPYTMVKMFDNE